MTITWRYLGSGSAALAALLALFAIHDGTGGGNSNDSGRAHADLPSPMPSALPVATQPSPTPEPERAHTREAGSRAESFAEMLGRMARSIGGQSAVMRERFEGLQAAYKLLKALGMSDADIARLVADQGRQILAREVEERNLTAAEARRVIENVQETVIRAAQDVDVRLDLGGDFARRVREGVDSTRAGREDVLLAGEKGYTAAREQLLKVLKK